MKQDNYILYPYILYIILIPFMTFPDFSYIKTGVQLSDVVFFCVALIFLWRVYLRAPTKIGLRYQTIFAIIIILLFVDLAMTGNYFKGLIRIVGQGYLFVVFLVSYYLAQSEESLKKVFIAYAWTSIFIIFLGVLGVVLYFLGADPERIPFISVVHLDISAIPVGTPRISATFPMGDYLPHYLMGGFFFYLYLYRKKYSLFRNKTFFYSLITLYILVSFGSMARSFFCWIIPFVGLETLDKKDWIRKAVGATIMVGIFLGIIVITIWTIYPVKIKNIPEENRVEISFSTKLTDPRALRWYPSAWQEIKKNPLWGRGPGLRAIGITEMFGDKWPDGVDAHNIVLNLWATRGIFGMIAYLCFWAMVVIIPFKRFYRREKPLELKILLATAIGMLIPSIFVDIEDFRHLYVILGLLSGYADKPFETPIKKNEQTQ